MLSTSRHSVDAPVQGAGKLVIETKKSKAALLPTFRSPVAKSSKGRTF